MTIKGKPAICLEQLCRRCLWILQVRPGEAYPLHLGGAKLCGAILPFLKALLLCLLPGFYVGLLGRYILVIFLRGVFIGMAELEAALSVRTEIVRRAYHSRAFMIGELIAFPELTQLRFSHLEQAAIGVFHELPEVLFVILPRRKREIDL